MNRYNKTNVVVAAFIAVILLGLWASYQAREHFWQRPVGMPVSGPGMSGIDGANIGGWTANEGLPVNNMPVNSPMDPNKLMVLANPSVSTSCCPSAYNNDMGCICLSEHDRRMFASRGGNKA